MKSFRNYVIVANFIMLPVLFALLCTVVGSAFWESFYFRTPVVFPLLGGISGLSAAVILRYAAGFGRIPRWILAVLNITVLPLCFAVAGGALAWSTFDLEQNQPPPLDIFFGLLLGGAWGFALGMLNVVFVLRGGKAARTTD